MRRNYLSFTSGNRRHHFRRPDAQCVQGDKITVNIGRNQDLNLYNSKSNSHQEKFEELVLNEDKSEISIDQAKMVMVQEYRLINFSLSTFFFVTTINCEFKKKKMIYSTSSIHKMQIRIYQLKNKNKN